jgi:GT2 family glycosyltransferase
MTTPSPTRIEAAKATPWTLGISVVVPADGRADLLDILLRELVDCRRRLTRPSEVIVVDSSPPDAAARIAASCASHDAIMLAGPDHVRAKRNLGVRQARGEIIVFLDSDCRPAPELLERYWQLFETDAAREVGGVLGVTEFDGLEGAGWRLAKNSSLIAQFSVAQRTSAATWGPTANIAFRHDVLAQLAPFDETFPFRLGGDDLDLSYRMVQAGWTLKCDPLAVVHHSRSTWNRPSAVLKRAFRWGRMQYYLFQKHREARVIAPPGFIAAALGVTAIFGVEAVILRAWAVLALAPVWAALSLVLFAVFAARGGRTREKGFVDSFKDEMLTSIPELTYEAGAALEFARRLDPRFFWSRTWFGPTAPEDSWLSEARNAWANVVALMVCQLLALVIAR